MIRPSTASENKLLLAATEIHEEKEAVGEHTKQSQTKQSRIAKYSQTKQTQTKQSQKSRQKSPTK